VPRDRKQSFWVTVPGLITAVAGLLSSAGALLGTLYAIGVFDGNGGNTVTGSATGEAAEQDADGDGIPDVRDVFAFDASNGRTTSPDLSLEFTEVDRDRRVPVGFTGLMIDEETSLEDLFDPSKVDASNGVLTVEDVDEGDPSKSVNRQRNAFQLGIDPRGHRTVFAHTRVQAPDLPEGLVGYQQMGLFIGAGDQDNYVKLVWQGRRIQALAELDARWTATAAEPLDAPPDRVDLYLTVDTRSRTVQPSYRLETDGVPAEPTTLGDPIRIGANWWGNTHGLAAGIIASSYGPAPPFKAAWDAFEVRPGRPPS
jgi:hypothetical protein